MKRNTNDRVQAEVIDALHLLIVPGSCIENNCSILCQDLSYNSRAKREVSLLNIISPVIAGDLKCQTVAFAFQHDQTTFRTGEFTAASTTSVNTSSGANENLNA